MCICTSLQGRHFSRASIYELVEFVRRLALIASSGGVVHITGGVLTDTNQVVASTRLPFVPTFGRCISGDVGTNCNDNESYTSEFYNYDSCKEIAPSFRFSLTIDGQSWHQHAFVVDIGNSATCCRFLTISGARSEAVPMSSRAGR